MNEDDLKLNDISTDTEEVSQKKFDGLSVVYPNTTSEVSVILDVFGEHPIPYIIDLNNLLELIRENGVRKGGYINDEFMLVEEDGKRKLIKVRDSKNTKDCVELQVGHVYKNVGREEEMKVYLGKYYVATFDLRYGISCSLRREHIFYEVGLLDYAEKMWGYGITTFEDIKNTSALVEYGELQHKQFNPEEFLEGLNKSLETSIIKHRMLTMELTKLRIFYDANKNALGGINDRSIFCMLRKNAEEKTG